MAWDSLGVSVDVSYHCAALSAEGNNQQIFTYITKRKNHPDLFLSGWVLIPNISVNSPVL